MTLINRIKKAQPEQIADNVRKNLSNAGYKANVTLQGKAVNVGQIRLASGHNEQVASTKSGFRKTNALSWDDWVNVNRLLNKSVDQAHGEANISSLHGKFKIREGKHEFTEADWEDLKYENVGSQMNPITRYDYIQPGHDKKKIREMV